MKQGLILLGVTELLTAVVGAVCGIVALGKYGDAQYKTGYYTGCVSTLDSLRSELDSMDSKRKDDTRRS